MNMLGAEAFLQEAGRKPVIDVRSPSEFAGGHIPGAVNIPLFDDAQRAVVGTLYKQSGRDASILKGLEIAGPRLAGFVQAARQLGKGNELLVHCWRGGMRSANMAWLFRLAGFQVDVLDGGYKAYRQFIRGKLGSFDRMVVLGGKTGSGKTAVLERLKRMGEQVLNLEEIAHHKGSAFGDLGQEDQPSSEQFENNLYQSVSRLDPAVVTFVEDESRGIGKLSIPDNFYQIMRSAAVVFLDVPKSERINRLVLEYSGFPRDRLAAAIQRIGKKLGGQNVKVAIEALETKDYATVADILLLYYDKAYMKGLSMREAERIFTLPVDADDPDTNAGLTIHLFETKVRSKYPGLARN